MPKVQANAAGAGRRGRRIASSLAEINVVPLVDVMLVLLIIFMGSHGPSPAPESSEPLTDDDIPF